MKEYIVSSIWYRDDHKKPKIYNKVSNGKNRSAAEALGEHLSVAVDKFSEGYMLSAYSVVDAEQKKQVIPEPKSEY